MSLAIFFHKIARRFAFYVNLVVGKYETSYNLLRIVLNKRKNGQVAPQVRYVNFLAVSNPIYLQALRTAVISLIFFNPHVRPIFHLDSEMKVAIQKKRWFSFIKDRIELREVSSTDWRMTKLKIIADLSGTHDLFCDADIRFNDLIPSFEGIQVLVNEGPKLQDFPYKPILQSLFIRKICDPTELTFMLNTSIFSWGGIEITESEKFLLFEYFKFIDHELRDSAKRRVSEQVAISLLIQSSGYRWNAWKATDDMMDGKIVESTYTGNTGVTF